MLNVQNRGPFSSCLRKTALLSAFLCLSVLRCVADNPIVQTNFTADPAPMVYKGVVYLYTSHDEDDATNFKMVNWKLYSSTDMVNWTDHGTVASLSIFPWANQTNDAWAPQVVERGGKFYLYAPVTMPGSPRNVIARRGCRQPSRSVSRPDRAPLIGRGEGYFDPTVFVDNDGQAYLYWGNPKLWYVKLNKDMVSYSGDIVEAGGRPENYQEGPWFYRRNDKYYMAYASHCCPEGIGYAMSNKPDRSLGIQGHDHGAGEDLLRQPSRDHRFQRRLLRLRLQLWAQLGSTDVHRERRSVCGCKVLLQP